MKPLNEIKPESDSKSNTTIWLDNLVTYLYAKPESDFKPALGRPRNYSFQNASDLAMDICQIGSAPFMHLTQNPRYEIFAASIANIEKTLALKKQIDFIMKIPIEYYKNLKVFS